MGIERRLSDDTIVEPIFIDLADNFSEPLLQEFYEELIRPNFSYEDSILEPLEVWKHCLLHPREASCRLHVMLILSAQTGSVIAGTACEYYPRSNCGLHTYIAVDSLARKRGLGRTLMEWVKVTLKRDARATGFDDCDAIFCEISCERVQGDHFAPHRRHVMQKLGYRILDFDYVQPPLSPILGKCNVLRLAVLVPFLVNSQKSFPSDVVSSFLIEFYQVLLGENEASNDPDLRRMLAAVDGKGLVSVWDACI